MPPLNAAMITSTECERAFRRMVLVFIFLLIDLKLAFLPDMILPDFLGWLMLAGALNLIMGMRSDVRNMRNTCCLLAALSVIWTFLALLRVVDIVPRQAVIAVGLGLDAVIVALEVYVIWWLCGLILDIASARQEERLQQDAATRRRLYVGLAVAIFVIRGCGQLLFLATARETLPGWLKSWGVFIGLGWFWIAIVTVILMITLMCLMIGLVRRTADMCKAPESPVA